jgi:hypothetical protein
MTLVQVNNAKGEQWTKILSGETAAQAKHRIQLKGTLENSAGLALCNDDLITEDEAPYVFKEALQQQQQNGMLRCSRIVVFNVLLEYGNARFLEYENLCISLKLFSSKMVLQNRSTFLLVTIIICPRPLTLKSCIYISSKAEN